jgi:hypothetical protein
MGDGSAAMLALAAPLITALALVAGWNLIKGLIWHS